MMELKLDSPAVSSTADIQPKPVDRTFRCLEPHTWVQALDVAGQECSLVEEYCV